MPDLEPPKSIVLLSGPVGAGKTTVARELVALSPGAIAYIEGDTFWSFIATGGESRKHNRNFKMIMTAMVAAAASYALYGYETIVDFSIPPWFLETAQRVVSIKKVPLDYVVLRPSEAVCAERAQTRSAGAVADYGPYRELYASFDEAARHMVSCDGNAATVAARIRGGLKVGSFRIP